MIFLWLNVIFASLFGLSIKWVENRNREDIVTVGMINYIVAAVLSCHELLSQPAPTAAAIGLGTTMGASYFIAFFFIIYAIKWIGVSNSTVISILSICVPILAGVLIWKESPSVIQWLGVGLALFSLLLIGKKGDAVSKGTVPDKPWFTPWVIGGFFILCGVSRLAQEGFRHLCTAPERPTFLTAAFFLAAIPSVAILLFRRKKILPMEWAIGTVLGIANISQTHFILKALKQYDGFIVFPITSAGNLVFVTLIATQLMQEKLGKSTYAGIAIACVALILLNWA